MAIFRSVECLHINGINETKNLTSSKDVVVLPNGYCKNIFIPLVDNKAKPISLTAKIGDEVKVGSLIGTYKLFDEEILVYSPVSGKIIEEVSLFHAGVGRNVNHFVVENDFQYLNEPVCSPFSKEDEPEVIIENIRKLSLIGLGGAGFPTFFKYKNNEFVDTLIIDGVECEPYITTDYVAMRDFSRELLEGSMILMKACKASKCFICFKKNKKIVKDSLEVIINEYPGIELFLVEDKYPLGWEKLLVKKVTGRNYNRLPKEANVIVNNVQTAIELYKSSLTGCILSHRQITVSGIGIKKNGNVIVPVGTKVSDVVEFMGGYTLPEGVLLLGGPMCSKAMMTDQIALTSNIDGIVVLEKKKHLAQPCLRCGRCSDHCPSNVQPVEVKLAVERKSIERLIELNPSACMECGLCSYICPSHIEVTDFVKKGKLLLHIEEIKNKGKGN